MQGLHGCAWQVGDLPANHRASGCTWSAVWRGSRCPMDTNRCHRASGCALEACRMAIAVPGEFHESEERVQREERVQSEGRVDPHLLLQSTRVQECRADYDLKANSKPI